MKSVVLLSLVFVCGIMGAPVDPNNPIQDPTGLLNNGLNSGMSTLNNGMGSLTNGMSSLTSGFGFTGPNQSQTPSVVQSASQLARSLIAVPGQLLGGVFPQLNPNMPRTGMDPFSSAFSGLGGVFSQPMSLLGMTGMGMGMNGMGMNGMGMGMNGMGTGGMSPQLSAMYQNAMYQNAMNPYSQYGQGGQGLSGLNMPSLQNQQLLQQQQQQQQLTQQQLQQLQQMQQGNGGMGGMGMNTPLLTGQ